MSNLIKIFDTHAHLHFENSIEPGIAIQNAQIAGVSNILTVSTEISCYKTIVPLTTKYDCIYGSVGVHPLSAHKYTHSEINEYLSLAAQDPKIIAIGETGLDDFRNPLNPQQIEVFKLHIAWAQKLNLPLILHLRSNSDLLETECARILKNAGIRVICHCYGSSLDFAQFVLKENPGSKISFAGNVTYKSAHSIRDVAKNLSLKDIIIETDSPYLSPDGHRGTTNQPAYILKTLDEIAKLHGSTVHDTAQVLYQNSLEIFGLSS